MHTTMATNGTTMTPRRAAELAEAGLRYVEISLDSVHPDRHDAFRGQAGMWQRAVAGAKAVAATPGLRLGIAMCVHQGNFDEVADMIALAEELGAGCFAHFNFIPVGRGLQMVRGDITPAQREQLLALLNQKMQAGGMGVISTAPQLGRVCLAGAAGEGGRVSCSHAGSGSGVKARVVAKYFGGCGAGRTYVCIEPTGDVTPCVYLPHRVMGNVRSAGLIDIFRHNAFSEVLNDRSHRLHHCEVCAFRNYCGGCRAGRRLLRPAPRRRPRLHLQRPPLAGASRCGRGDRVVRSGVGPFSARPNPRHSAHKKPERVFHATLPCRYAMRGERTMVKGHMADAGKGIPDMLGVGLYTPAEAARLVGLTPSRVPMVAGILVYLPNNTRQAKG